tara:strand:+ start:407 stop:586 length:180 start_codon:yes stop_codon:yes gene_type:complete
MQLWLLTFISIAFIILAMALGGHEQQAILDGAKFSTKILVASNIVIDTVIIGIYILFKR